jgi:glycosyltransferase involved in cell wall biosynthesis
MACGVPALAHTACGNSEVIKDGANGWIRDLGDPGRIGEALEAVLAGPGSLAELGRAARITIETRFAFAGMVAGYRALYRALAQVKD